MKTAYIKVNIRQEIESDNSDVDELNKLNALKLCTIKGRLLP